MKIVVAGDTGLLGQALVTHFGASHQVAGFSTSEVLPSSVIYNHETLNILKDFKRIENLVDDFVPDIFINCAGLVDVKKCEENPKLAAQLNADSPLQFSRLCAKKNTKYIHISTDQVFDGQKKVPYRETDGTNPLNQYGATKLLAEKNIAQENPGALVLRTNIVGWRGRSGAPTFVEWLSKSLYSGSPIGLADDFVTSSIHVDFLCRLIQNFIARNASGLFHASSKDAISKYEFGLSFSREAKLDFSAVTRKKLSDLALKPQRPPYLGLDVQKAERVLGYEFPTSFQTICLLADQFLKQKEVVRGT